jgi:hypothetical protein
VPEPGSPEFHLAPSPAGWDYDDETLCPEECNDVLALFNTAADIGTDWSTFQLTRRSVEPPSVAITRMEEGAVAPPTPPTPRARRTTHLVPFETLARWRPAAALPPPSPALPPMLAARQEQARTNSSYIHDVVAAARRGTFKGIVPFHSIADHQKLARTGGRLWCHEVASDV